MTLKNKFKLDIQLFAVTITKREDSAGYVEGFTYGQAIMLGLGMRTWLVPNRTFTQHALNESGQVLIPIFKPGTLKGATDLCAEGSFNKATKDTVTVSLDKKIGGEFDGCFTVAGIAKADWERYLNNATLMQMAMDYQATIETYINAGGTVSTVSPTGLTPSAYLNKMRAEYFDLTKRQASIALVNVDFYNSLIEQQTNLGTAGSDFAFINGVVGTVSGLIIIQTDLEAPVTLISVDAIHIVTASNPKQVPQFGDIIGGADMSELGIGFSVGMISKTDVQPKFIGATTYVHLPLGVKVIDELILKAPVVPAP